MALRTLDGSLVGAIIAFQGEGPTGNPSPKGTFLMPPVGDIFMNTPKNSAGEDPKTPYTTGSHFQVAHAVLRAVSTASRRNE